MCGKLLCGGVEAVDGRCETNPIKMLMISEVRKLHVTQTATTLNLSFIPRNEGL